MISRVFFVVFLLFTSFFQSHSLALKSNKPVSQGPKVYITIDDGPLSGMEHILEAVQIHQAPVTLFLVGSHMQEKEGVCRQFGMAVERLGSLILVGNHSFSHANAHYKLFYQNPKRVVRDMDKNRDCLREAFQASTTLMARLPGRNTWRVGKKQACVLRDTRRAADLLVEKGYTLWGWDIEWNPSQRLAEAVPKLVERVLSQAPRAFTPGHVVLLAHDPMFHTLDGAQALRALFVALRAEGCELRTLDAYPSPSVNEF